MAPVAGRLDCVLRQSQFWAAAELVRAGMFVVCIDCPDLIRNDVAAPNIKLTPFPTPLLVALSQLRSSMWPGQRHGIGTWKIEVAVRMQSPGGGDLLLTAAPPSLSVTPAVGVRRYAARAPRLPYASDLVFQPVVRLRGASCQPSTLRQDGGQLPSRIHRWFKFGNESGVTAPSVSPGKSPALLWPAPRLAQSHRHCRLLAIRKE